MSVLTIDTCASIRGDTVTKCKQWARMEWLFTAQALSCFGKYQKTAEGWLFQAISQGCETREDGVLTPPPMIGTSVGKSHSLFSGQILNIFSVKEPGRC